MAESYDSFYKWFRYLKTTHTDVLAYCIVPNHFHCILAADERASRSLSSILGNGKRFIAYDIIRKLQDSGYFKTLNYLSRSLNTTELTKNQRHKVFKPSFHSSLIETSDSLHRVIEYIHLNPVSKNWKLVDDWRNYPFSSAPYYELDMVNEHFTHFSEWMLGPASH